MIFSLTGDEYLSTINSDEFYKFIARYKFVIAYENSVCEDYITEKLWRPLIVGVVPIYYGAPNVQVIIHFLYYIFYTSIIFKGFKVHLTFAYVYIYT